MTTTRVSSKGQVVLPKAVRDAHGWMAGTELEVVDRASEVVLRPKAVHDSRFPPITLEEFKAMRPKVFGPPITDEEIREVVLREAARRYDAERD
ncbi:AbrB/MazE/SpoVT family DNA-binding domain-containing protein [Allomesorhizobium camelthorni]|uniref:AbrB/MazE/SpoVT family DNA-binding domain-containing protein n=1 Tax=Allomesorhizobium camelthorni TaxID=475069 RepID=A0A6G4W612_9HYPH|nr:AbrB/MazE/SpoVT family DNA-binding domain-containing protein [Mesorhizobium camelthorni]NGO50039.1 AbrB/MazE/SpoVT family DNA-binding domain-containing protein [Mesorhizobium camelthorni]